MIKDDFGKYLPDSSALQNSNRECQATSSTTLRFGLASEFTAVICLRVMHAFATFVLKPPIETCKPKRKDATKPVREKRSSSQTINITSSKLRRGFPEILDQTASLSGQMTSKAPTMPPRKRLRASAHEDIEDTPQFTKGEAAQVNFGTQCRCSEHPQPFLCWPQP